MRLSRRLCFLAPALASAAFSLATPPLWAAEPVAPPADASVESAPSPTLAVSDSESTASKPAATAPAPNVPAGTETASLAEEVRQLRERVAEQERKLEQLQSDVEATNTGADSQTEDPKLAIYGFMDVGFQRSWVKRDSAVATFINGNAGTFVIGNLNTYFDAQPSPSWRGLLELRFSNAPLGRIEGVGGLGGTFKRTTTEQLDPNAASLDATMWGGYSVIERAQIDWRPQAEFNLRAGYFFTPFGIWNEDHGSPTLISTMLPQLVSQKLIPSRQMGLMAFGHKVLGPWELGYALTLSNGRQELSALDFDDDKGVGGRVFARYDSNPRWQFGLSFYRGDNNDKVIDLVSVAPSFKFESYERIRYEEWVAGLDVSADVGDTRIRAEGLIRRMKWDEGKREVVIPIFAQGGYEPDGYFSTAYLLAAHQLPWAGLEPFVFTEVIHGPFAPSTDSALLSAGANVHFTPATTLKTQFARAIFYNTGDGERPPDPSQHNVWLLFTRLVLVY